MLFAKNELKYSMERKICPVCNMRPVAHNYTDKNGVLHYRRVCDICKRAGKKIKPAEFSAVRTVDDVVNAVTELLKES